MSVLEIDGDCPPDLGAELEEVMWSSLHPDDRLQRDRIGIVTASRAATPERANRSRSRSC